MTILFSDARFQGHETGTHKECPERLRAIDAELLRTGLAKRCQIRETRLATVDEIARIHDRAYIGRAAQFAKDGGGWIEADTFLSPKSYDVALRAAGTSIQAIDAVMAGPDQQALCLVRPPGHHALVHDAMGFCLFNNIALAADHAVKQHKLRRVLVVDWDVHHGNGTQDIFYERDDVWFLSVHRSPFYPGTGMKDETGSRLGLGTKYNLPVAFGTARKDYLSQFEAMLTDVAKKCQPELVLISAGFDAHAEDPIGSLGLETEDFGTLTHLVMQVAQTYSQGRLVSCLEGGYHVKRLAESVACHLTTLLANPR
ncbi:histone deacetylase family protein [Schlesneria paludicola]|uniref:histone deacetylase family protein n=1 Tax=Schlesneria paludicola TaxID=360056 RepID=UPI00029B4B70|nr:histone deacetylase [Schlesneria paludicola]